MTVCFLLNDKSDTYHAGTAGKNADGSPAISTASDDTISNLYLIVNSKFRFVHCSKKT